VTHRVTRALAATLLLIGLVAAPGTAGAAAPRTWHLVALGDSIPYGGRYCGNCTPYPFLLGRALGSQSGHPIVARDLGIPGLTTQQLLDNVRHRSNVRAAIASADIVTITIGHNDTPWNSRHDSCDGADAWFGPYHDARFATYMGPCLATEAHDLQVRLDGILTTIRTLRGSRPTLIELTTDWNQLIGRSGLPAGAVTATRTVLDRFAAAACAAAQSHAARCGDVYHAFNGPTGTHSAVAFLAADHDHASQVGHTQIAAILARFGYSPLPK
jgi:lysophospholipase L1-like esterase